MAKTHIAAFTSLLLLAAPLPTFGEEPYDLPLANPRFADGVNDRGVPLGWSPYGSGGPSQKLDVTEVDDAPCLLLSDGDRNTEIGISQTFELKGGETYEVTAKVRRVEGVSPSGAYLQLRFLPSNQLVQTALQANSETVFSTVSVRGQAPPDTTQGVIYLYSHRGPTPQVLIREVRLQGGLPAPPPPPPPPVPPQYDKLKNLHLNISLVENGKPASAIIVPASGLYDAAAMKICRAIADRTGVELPILSEESELAGVPLRDNLIVLGNRSTNRTINALYDHYYCLADLKYPGPEGYILRTVHNPYGNGHSVVLVGASDLVGVDQGADALAKLLASAPASNGSLSLGWTMKTQLGKGVVPPTDIRQFETWEASRGYGSIGYFGWCSISKHMAMYYMTGNEASAREVLRLSFPDEQAIRDIEAIDGERIENKHDPLAGFYHYNAHMAILFWDLIEESPLFTDEQRLKITNAFARQLNHRKGEGVYGRTKAPSSVGSRHGQWAAISLYCLGRYFNKDYPDPVWAQCVRGGELSFAPLHHHAWIAGESDNLFWYCTGIAPIFTYLALTGDRVPLENGVVGQLLRGQEALISGRDRDWALNSASIGMLNKAAYLTGDGRWIDYRERTGVDASLFRLGQSFWPDESLPPQPPEDLVGRWNIDRIPEPAWESRGSGLPLKQSFYFGSFRSAPDATGDFILLDGFNGASRNPYHTFDILELRLDGDTILDGYHNQVLTSADGMVEPVVPMDAALLHAGVVGPTATAVAEVPGTPFCNWRRSLAQHTGQYALIVDDLTFRTDSRNMSVSTSWEIPGGRWDDKLQAVRCPGSELHSGNIQAVDGRGIVTMTWNGAVERDAHRVAFYLIGRPGEGAEQGLACTQVANNAAALALPQPAIAVVGNYEQTKAALAVVAQDHLHGHALTSAGVDSNLVSSDAPIEIDWDFLAGTVHVVAEQPTRLKLAVADARVLRMNGKPVQDTVLPPGRHTITGATLEPDLQASLTTSLERILADGKKRRDEQLAARDKAPDLEVREAPVQFSCNVDGKIADMAAFHTGSGTRLAVAAGNNVQLLNLDGKTVGTLQADGAVRVIHWWPEPGLLLAGCVDEKVIAFDLEGRRKWTFVSQMDPAVYEAAKTYWFKSAPGHEGIHGLHTGRFDDNKSRCFVGSACTLEILDETGTLVKRTPVFWGPGRRFILVDGPEGTRNLLIARQPNGTDFLSIVNSRSMTVTGRGYYDVPAGHSFVSGWSAQNRTGLFRDDLDGDGRPEVATAINGTWNRVTIYTENGTPRYNAQFGPGPRGTPRARVRDMDIADVNGDGQKEILIGLSEGLVVCLNHTCGKVWATRLPSPPASLRHAGTQGGPPIVVGCEDGTVIALDALGEPMQIGQVTGRPWHMTTIDTDSGPLTVLGTEKGEVKAFTISE